jgi:hypothetical protein
MKKVFIVLNIVSLVIVAGAFRLLAQKASGPVFSAEKMEVNFGEVEYKGEGTRELYLKT